MKARQCLSRRDSDLITAISSGGPRMARRSASVSIVVTVASSGMSAPPRRGLSPIRHDLAMPVMSRVSAESSSIGSWYPSFAMSLFPVAWRLWEDRCSRNRLVLETAPFARVIAAVRAAVRRQNPMGHFTTLRGSYSPSAWGGCPSQHGAFGGPARQESPNWQAFRKGLIYESYIRRANSAKNQPSF